MHQKRNRSICPPKLIPYRNHGETSLAVSHHTTDTSKASHRQPVDHAVPRPCHANDTSKASHCQPVDHADTDTPMATRTTMGQMKRLSMVQTITTLMMKMRIKILKSMCQNNDDHAHSIMTSALHNYASILVLGSMF